MSQIMCLIQIRPINLPICILLLESSAPWGPTRHPHLAVVGIVDLANKLGVYGGRRGSVGRSGEDGRGRFLGEVRVARAAVWLV